MSPTGCGTPIASSASANRRRSSARSIASTDEPRIATPWADSGSARLIAVWPPNCTTAPATSSVRATAAAEEASSGSKYRRSDVSKSVETVSGLELTMIALTPTSRSAHAACTEQ